ncbi:hypothetical protein MHU86_14872 [Fragilaria crotonensis]|nr:hypothetical protein MHU86_14872 [Fragilaria crotonensis]
MAPLTDGQVIILILINIVSSSLSIGGSCIIVYLVSIAKKPSVYNRMMFGLSMADILHSICLLISPFLLPSEGGRIWAHGNDQTCTMLGFFVQLGVIVPLYNASLNAFFLLTIVYGTTESRIKKWAEPTMHAVPILYPLVTASIGVGISLYSENELGLTCWIGEYPRGCDVNPEVECVSTLIGWIYGGIPHVGTLVFLIISNAMIYRKVRITTRQSDQYSIENIDVPQTDIVTATDSVSADEGIDVQRGCCIGLIARVGTYFKQRNVLRSRQSEGDRIENGVSIIGTSSETPVRILQRRRRASLTSRGNRKIKAVARQATLYVVACFSTMVWMLILRTLESSGVTREEESGIYWIVVMTSITYPLEGFWNLLIFIGPKYRRYRRNEPKRSRWWALRQCLGKPGSTS